MVKKNKEPEYEKEKGFWGFMLSPLNSKTFTYFLLAIVGVVFIIWQIITNN